MRECVCVWLRDGRHEAPTPPPTVITTLLWITWQLRGRSTNSVSGGGTCSAAAEVFSAPRTAQSNCARRERFLSTEGFVLIILSMAAPQPRLSPPWRISFQHTDWGSFCKKKIIIIIKYNKRKSSAVETQQPLLRKQQQKQAIFWCKMTHWQVRHTLFIPRAT